MDPSSRTSSFESGSAGNRSAFLVLPSTPLPPPSTSSRRLPPPCWTNEEIPALIDAYCDKWNSLGRGNLRSHQWAEIAGDLARRCPSSSAPKTSTQCRNKVEKLRKRYRSEKHRSILSWPYFQKMDDAMNRGAAPSKSVDPRPSSGGELTRGIEEMRRRVEEKRKRRDAERNAGGDGDLTAAVGMLGDMLLSMEGKKLEMAMEVQKVRMEIELKRTEMILHCHRRIFDAMSSYS
ncbi:hypothetical protein KSP40_PGU013918 [Platanthera guangdongensis]|uniref:Myb/SANT-like DNA-binding domain-containing protein n=1 Tax=Platanthera guangdongensis TaxID=2320717 RepID=A0ABR2MS32_9ASPA